MKSSEHIIMATDSNFPYEVLAYSSRIPVVVDFWAEWCQPCKLLSPLLEKLAVEYAGGFRLAKIDVDENPQLVMEHQVQSIPAVKAFRNGQVVAEFNGLRPEAELREFLRQATPGQSDLTLEKGKSLLTSGQWGVAQHVFRQVVKGNPDHPGGLLGLAMSYLAQGEVGSALPILREFPASKEYRVAEQLLPLAEALAALEAGELEGSEEDIWLPMYANALRLVSKGNLEAAVDGLLDILRENKKYRQGEIRKVAVALLHLLGEENPISRAYRSELSSLLF
jgi:putative thioredoxin